MKIFNKVAIIGTGLIGGSLALALKKKRLARVIIGISRHRSTLRTAKRIGAIDVAGSSLGIINDADLVIFAAPVGVILKLAEKSAKFIKPGCIVIDVGSTKEAIVAKLEKVFTSYVGTHPLAGSEKRGIGAACADIFSGSLCILTPTRRTPVHAVKEIKRLWEEIGAKVTFLSPKEHDRVICVVSHLPHLAAFSLMSAVPARYLGFAAGGLKDVTRIALSDSQLWAEIFLSNGSNIVKAADLFKDRIDKIRSCVNKKDRAQLIKILTAARRKRELLR